MAVSKPLGENIDQLTCALCLELYKSPKVLPCLHTFCEQCLEKFIASVGTSKEDQVSQFRCPICRTKVNPIKQYKEVQEWVRHFQSNRIITLMLAKQEGLRINCDPCKIGDETSDAKVWCPSCTESLCEMCAKVHNRMKISKDHCTIELIEIYVQSRGLDFSAISEFCLCHARKDLDYFCADHDQLCCSVCVYSNHKSCKTMSIHVKDRIGSDLRSLPGELTAVKDEAFKLLEDRKQQKTLLTSYAEKAKKDAATFTENLKSKLDNLLEAFNKHVNILQEEENTELNVAIRLIEQLLAVSLHWTNVVEVVPENASETKRFQIKKTINRQLGECINELILQMDKHDIVGLKFDDCGVEEIVKSLETLDRIGSIVVSKSSAPNMMSTAKVMCEKAKIVSNPSLRLPFNFETVSVTFIRKITIQGMNIACGTCLDANNIIVGIKHVKRGGNYQVRILSKETGETLSKIAIEENMKSICFDQRNNIVHLACHSQALVTFELKATQCKITSLSKTKRLLGGICCREEQVFLVDEGFVLTFNSSLKPEGSFKTCFKSSTDYSSLGLAVYDDSLFYNTKDNEIKRTTIDGTDIFCFKSSTIAKPCNLAVLSSGLVLVVNTSGKLHALSDDGKKYRVLLETFENVESPTDLWLDSDGLTFYVCGGENIDVYRIH